MQRPPIGRKWHHHQRGFTLAEIVVTVVLMGIVFIAALTALQGGTTVNYAAADMNTALGLVNEVREWTIDLPFIDPQEHQQGDPVGPNDYYGDGTPMFDDLDDLMNATFSPPRDSRGNPIASLANWQQQVTITWRDPADITQEVTAGTSGVVFVEAIISKGSEEVLRQGWIITASETN